MTGLVFNKLNSLIYFNLILSIIIPCYNVVNCVNDTLYSLFLEQNSEVEFIVINDGSKDGTYIAIQDFLLKYPIKKLKLFNIENCGLSEARNYGISEATGDYIWFLDGDDALKFGAVNEILKIIIENIDVKIIAFQGYDFEDRILGFDEVNYYSDRNWLIETYNRGCEMNKKYISNEYIIDRIINGNYLSNASFYVTKNDILSSSEISFLKSAVYEDVIFTVKLFLCDLSLLVVPNRLIMHRRRIGSITRSKIGPHHLKSMFRVVNELKKLYVVNAKYRELVLLIDKYLYLGLRRTRDNGFSILPFLFRYPILILARTIHSPLVKNEFIKNLKNSIKLLIRWISAVPL
jgi:glycosyltransferase involved in cell wall biosynthesis